MNQQLKDSIVHTLATMILDVDNPRFQNRCRLTIAGIIANKSSSEVHSDLSRCLMHVPNCDDADGINALILAVQMHG